MSTYPSCKHDFSDPMGVCPLCEQENKIESLEQQLASAHREGWEQAKREAEESMKRMPLIGMTSGAYKEYYLASVVQNAIVSMEYKGEKNDR